MVRVYGIGLDGDIGGGWIAPRAGEGSALWSLFKASDRSISHLPAGAMTPLTAIHAPNPVTNLLSFTATLFIILIRSWVSLQVGLCVRGPVAWTSRRAAEGGGVGERRDGRTSSVFPPSPGQPSHHSAYVPGYPAQLLPSIIRPNSPWDIGKSLTPSTRADITVTMKFLSVSDRLGFCRAKSRCHCWRLKTGGNSDPPALRDRLLLPQPVTHPVASTTNWIHIGKGWIWWMSHWAYLCEPCTTSRWQSQLLRLW